MAAAVPGHDHVGRQHDRVGQPFDVDVDQGECDPDGAEVEEGEKLGLQADPDAQRDEDAGGRQLDERVADTDAGPAVTAATAQDQPAQHRDVIAGPHGVVAGRAV
jgi:hypothetical protein